MKNSLDQYTPTDKELREFYSYQELLCENCKQELNWHDFPGGPCLKPGYQWCKAFMAPGVDK